MGRKFFLSVALLCFFAHITSGQEQEIDPWDPAYGNTRDMVEQLDGKGRIPSTKTAQFSPWQFMVFMHHGQLKFQFAGLPVSTAFQVIDQTLWVALAARPDPAARNDTLPDTAEVKVILPPVICERLGKPVDTALFRLYVDSPLVRLETIKPTWFVEARVTQKLPQGVIAWINFPSDMPMRRTLRAIRKRLPDGFSLADPVQAGWYVFPTDENMFGMELNVVSSGGFTANLGSDSVFYALVRYEGESASDPAELLKRFGMSGCAVHLHMAR